MSILYCSILTRRIGKHWSEAFPIQKGLKHEVALPTLLLTFVSHYNVGMV